MRALIYILILAVFTITASYAEASSSAYSKKGCGYPEPNKYPVAINVGWK